MIGKMQDLPIGWYVVGRNGNFHCCEQMKRSPTDVVNGSPIKGNICCLFVRHRCEVGTTHWIQCNDTPVKFARFPVTGLVEGRSYVFRVRAVNKSGMSHPSRASEPIAAMDPADRARMKGHTTAPWTGQIIVTEEEPVGMKYKPVTANHI